MEGCLYTYFWKCGYFWGQWVSFVMTDPHWRSQKLLQGLLSHELAAYLSAYLLDLFLTQWIMVILWKECKPDNFEPYKSLKLSFTNIWGLHSNFVECEYCFESNSPDILTPCKINLDDLIDPGNFSVRCYLPLIRKDSITHMYGLEVYLKEGLPFVQDLPLENSSDSYLCFWLALLHSVS